MYEKLLSKIIKKIVKEHPNSYKENTRTNITKLLELELNNLNIDYEKKKRKYKKGQYFFEIKTSNSDKKKIKLIRNSYPNNNKVGWKISNDKLLTEKFLKLANLKTPNTKVFNESEYEKAKTYVETFEGKFIIKPLDLSQSLGVYLDVPVEKFKEYWESCITIQKQYNKVSPKIIIQKYVEGMELRIVVNEGEVGSATIKVPAFVIGDGKKTIEQLIDERNAQLLKNPYLLTKVIKKDESLNYNLKVKNRTKDTVLNENKVCILFPESNIGEGRTFFEVTKHIHPKILNQAIDASKAIPGLQTTGIDIIIEDFDAQEGTIIEVNKSPAYQLNYYPEYGEPTNPLNYIIRSVVTESKILDAEVKAEDLTSEEIEILMNRYRFLHSKHSILEQSLEKYLEDGVD